MKIDKTVKKTATIALTFLVIGLLLGVVIVFAATPSSTIYIGGGIYPGAPSYSIWREGSIFFVKNRYGNKVYDSTNASQIISNCIQDKTSIFITAGYYPIDSTIIVDKRVMFTGEGNATVLGLTANVNMFNVTSDEVRFYDLTLVGNNYTGAAIEIDTQMNCRMENMRIWKFDGVGIYIKGQGNHWITTSRITLCQYAIHIAYSADNYIADNDLGACEYNVLELGGAHNVVSGNRIYMGGYNWSGAKEYHAYRGVDLWQAKFQTVSDNQIAFCGGSGILAHQTNVTTISDNYIYNNDQAASGRAGIRISGGSYALNIVGNEFNNEGVTPTQDYGIKEEDGDYNNIVGCYAYNQTVMGISITGANTKVMSSWNGTTYIGGGEAGPAGPAGGLEGAQPYSYLIFENVTSKYLQDGSDGSIITNNADASVLVQYVVDNYDTWWLHFTEGTFECNTQVDFGTETYFMITGSGWSTIIQLTANLGTATDFWEWDYTASTHGRFIIRDLYFDMQGDTYTSRDCISIVGGERWKLENIKILMPYRDGLNIDETGGAGYTRYNTVESFQVYYAGRYGVYCDGRDNNFFDIQVEYSWDTCFVFDTAGVGNSLFRLHATGAHNTGQYYGSGVGGGLSRYAGLEIRGTVAGGNTCHGVYLDRCNKSGAYITGSNNALIGGRVYECNYQAGSSAYADVYIDGDYNRVVGMELNGQSSNPTNYGVHLDTGSNNCAVTSNIGRDHAIAHFQDDGVSNEVAHNA